MRHTRYVWWLVVALVLFSVPRAANAQAEAGYAGSAACLECHQKVADTFAATAMGKLITENSHYDAGRRGCESCHGPSKAHAESGGEERPPISFGRKSTTPVTVRNATCLSCHEKTARALWKGSTHESRDVACTSCHTVMQEKSERAALKQQTVVETCAQCHADKKAKLTRFSHMPLAEGKMDCTSCHNPHGSANEKMLIASSVSETCYSCHTEKRGPFLWEHMPVVEGCANCHDSHGSNKEKMLKVSRPRLCQQCHPTAHGGTTAKPTDAAAVRFVYNKACSNCHFNIHGSNHPAGAFFTR
ncbi:MAG TPA: DmsE family decaheme c-type cytochrome [Longimicrobiales bacterium]